MFIVGGGPVIHDGCKEGSKGGERRVLMMRRKEKWKVDGRDFK
jgi:hypothetical protein